MERDSSVVYAVLTLRAILGWVLLTSSLDKLRQISSFQDELRSYPGMKPGLVGPIGVLVPLSELFLALGLFAGVQTKAVALATVAFLAVLTAALATRLRSEGRQSEVSCGCGGIVPFRSLGWFHIAFNAVLLTMATGSLVLGEKARSVSIAHDASTMFIATASLSVLLLFTVAHSISQVRSARTSVDSAVWEGRV